MPNARKAAAGALAGAGAGAAFGPWGAGIGGIAGGLLGLFGGDDDLGANPYHQKEADLAETGYGGMIAGANRDVNSNYGQQQGYVDMLRQQATGAGGPSPAQMMLRQATQDNISGGASMIASQRGLNPALAARMGVDATSAANQRAAGQGALLGAQEQLATRGLLGQALGQQGSQALGRFGTAGSLQNTQNANRIANAGMAGSINAGVAGQNAQTDANFWGGLLNAGGAAIAKGFGGGPALAPTGGSGPGFTGEEGWTAKNINFADGGEVDDEENDTVPAMLSPGEIVLPVSVAQSADAPDQAKAFVEAIRRKSGGQRKGYGKVLAHAAKARAAIDELEKFVGGMK